MRFEVHWLDCASVAFILLCWLFGAKKKKKKKSYAYSVFTSLVYGIIVFCRRYYGLIIIGHFGLRDFFFL